MVASCWSLTSLLCRALSLLSPSFSPIWQCFVQCFFQKLRLMDEKGVVLKDKLEVFLTKLMDADKAKDYVQQCDLRRTNPCDTAYAVYDCYLGKKAKLF
ncbi:uncharacterized protein LOC120896324 [Anopheles arabiensis]|uniref:uncharacterized protein LOC120896324 n=1 Tax=Anopheles arabiensis TaxID=7173 RepID=UPI001AAC5D11|nr:uncharacterized protein LOC120896324 [Anopheles arabiensis]